MEAQNVPAGDSPPAVDPIRVADLDQPTPVDELAPPEALPVAPVDEFMSKDDFEKLFFAAHTATAIGIRVAKGPALRTLVTSRGIEGFREASDALYDACADLPWMHWVLKRSGKWAMRAGLVALYGINLANAIADELAAQRARDAKPADASHDRAQPQEAASAQDMP
jgi:hypothetical protein